MTAETNRTTFTGQRLDWEKCLRFDRRIYPLAYEIAVSLRRVPPSRIASFHRV